MLEMELLYMVKSMWTPGCQTSEFVGHPIPLCSAVQLCWNRKGPSPKCLNVLCHKHKIPFSETKETKPWKQFQINIPPAPLLKLYCSVWFILLVSTKPRLLHQTIRWSSMSHNSRERFHGTRVQWLSDLYHSSWHLALCAAAWPWKAPKHSASTDVASRDSLKVCTECWDTGNVLLHALAQHSTALWVAWSITLSDRAAVAP